jgi:hypothetical protein
MWINEIIEHFEILFKWKKRSHTTHKKKKIETDLVHLSELFRLFKLF